MNGSTTYIPLNNCMGDNVGNTNGGQMMRFKPTHALFQDWVLSGGTNPAVFMTSHKRGGNVMFVDGSVRWVQDRLFYGPRMNASGMAASNIYLYEPYANTRGYF